MRPSLFLLLSLLLFQSAISYAQSFPPPDGVVVTNIAALDANAINQAAKPLEDKGHLPFVIAFSGDIGQSEEAVLNYFKTALRDYELYQGETPDPNLFAVVMGTNPLPGFPKGIIRFLYGENLVPVLDRQVEALTVGKFILLWQAETSFKSGKYTKAVTVSFESVADELAAAQATTPTQVDTSPRFELTAENSWIVGDWQIVNEPDKDDSVNFAPDGTYTYKSRGGAYIEQGTWRLSGTLLTTIWGRIEKLNTENEKTVTECKPEDDCRVDDTVSRISESDFTWTITNTKTNHTFSRVPSPQTSSSETTQSETETSSEIPLESRWIIGNWHSEREEVRIEVNFSADRTYTLHNLAGNPERGTWQLSGNDLTQTRVDENGIERRWTSSVELEPEGASFIWIDEDGSTIDQWSRGNYEDVASTSAQPTTQQETTQPFPPLEGVAEPSEPLSDNSWIVGAWQTNEGRMLLNFAADGTYTANGAYTAGDSEDYQEEGTWQLNDNQLIRRFTFATGTEVRLPGGDTIAVERISDTSFTCVIGNTSLSWTRVQNQNTSEIATETQPESTQSMPSSTQTEPSQPQATTPQPTQPESTPSPSIFQPWMVLVGVVLLLFVFFLPKRKSKMVNQPPATYKSVQEATLKFPDQLEPRSSDTLEPSLLIKEAVSAPGKLETDKHSRDEIPPVETKQAVEQHTEVRQPPQPQNAPVQPVQTKELTQPAPVRPVEKVINVKPELEIAKPTAQFTPSEVVQTQPKTSQPVAPQLKSKIFISYRRDDSNDVTGRINDRLVGHFGQKAIFKDVDSIPFGADFRKQLSNAVGRCDVCLVVIGSQWINAIDDTGKRRLDDPKDFVRIEVESALQREIPVIPLLVRGAKMPKEEDLPESLRELANRQGTPVRHDPDFHRDVDRLIKSLEEHYGI
jgi:TIR domain